MGRRRNKQYKFSHKDDPPPNDVWLLAWNSGLVRSFWHDFYIIKSPKWGHFRSGWWKPCSWEKGIAPTTRCCYYYSSLQFDDIKCESTYETSGPALYLGESSIIPESIVERFLAKEEYMHYENGPLQNAMLKEFNVFMEGQERLLCQELFVRGVDGLPSRLIHNYPEGKGKRS